MLMPRYSEQDNHTDTSFGGKHGHAPHNTTVAAHTKMRLLSKVEQNMRQNQQIQNTAQNSNPSPNSVTNPNQSIKKLINTAASGNRLVGDVDELLVPMRIKSDVADRDYIPGQKDGISRPERNLWSRAEMLEMLQIMQQMNALDQLSDRNVKSEHVFRQIEEMMRSKGYVKKSSIQIWTKWKFLKSTYNTTTRHGNGIPKVVPEEVYRVLSRMLSEHGGGNGSSSGNNIGSECGNSMDSSNAELHKAIAESDDVRDELGVEHPIFGFRLGLVKSEPLDAGYETPLNATNSTEQEIEAVDFVQNSNSDSMPDQTMEHTPFTMSVKHEPEIDLDLGMDGTNTPPPTAPTSPSPPPPPAQPGSVEQRDTGDRTPQSTSLPPLRVAAFASDSRRGLMSSTPTHGVLQIERPGSLPSKASTLANPLKSGNRSMPLQSTSSINFVHPTSKLMLPRKQLPMRIPREISLQPASVRPLKAVPMRETGYSLRPDRMIPDLEQSISPPQSPSPPMHSPSVGKFNMPYASTSRQAQQLNEQLHPLRKRRLNFPTDLSPVPVKLQRSSASFESKRKLEEEDQQQQQRSKLLAEETTQRRRQQQQQQHEDIFKKEMAELASAMHVAQKEMLEDFFQRQKVFARKEHEFQLRQDNLVMSALRKQTDALLQTAQQLIKSEEQQMLQSKEPKLLEQQRPQPQHRPQRAVQATELLEDENAEALEQEQEHEQEHEEMCEEEDELDEEYDDDYSDDDNRSESALVISSLAHSEDASSNSGIPNDRQLSS